MASNGRRYNRNRRARGGGLMDIAKMAGIMAVLVLAVILGIRMTQRVPSADTFCEGVYVNGVSLGGMTHEEGVATVNALIDQRINKDTYVLAYQDKQWSFTPSEFGASLDLTTELNLAWNFGHTGTVQEMRSQAANVKENPVHYNREVTYDEQKLDEYIAQIKRAIDVDPVSAQVTVLEGEQLEISQSQDGLSLSAEKLKDTLVNSLLSGNAQVIQLEPDIVKPQYTTEELEENTQLIVTYRTSLVGSTTNRKRNVKRALDAFNGVAAYPNQVVSFNETVGKRTKGNGFYEAPEYDFNEVTTGIGGGTCQASTTLYGAVLLANLDIVVRGCHSMTVGYVDPSLDAAVSETKDFKFINNLKYPVFFYTSCTDRFATVKVYGPRPPHRIELESKIIKTYPAQGSKYEKDLTGKIVYFTTDPPVLKTEGKQGMKSQAFRVYYDWETGAEVDRQDMDIDTYYASQPVYYVGVH